MGNQGKTAKKQSGKRYVFLQDFLAKDPTPTVETSVNFELFRSSQDRGVL